MQESDNSGPFQKNKKEHDKKEKWFNCFVQRLYLLKIRVMKFALEYFLIDVGMLLIEILVL